MLIYKIEWFCFAVGVHQWRCNNSCYIVSPRLKLTIKSAHFFSMINMVKWAADQFEIVIYIYLRFLDSHFRKPPSPWKVQVLIIKIKIIGASLNMVFIVTYYLKLRNSISAYFTPLSFTNKGRIGCLGIIEYWHLYSVENYIDDKKKDIGMCNSE